MWSSVLGFLTCLIIGYIASYILLKINPTIFGNNWQTDKMEINATNVDDNSTVEDKWKKFNLPNPDLFTPIYSNIIRKRNEVIINSKYKMVSKF